MNKPEVFISHITEETKLAQIFKNYILEDFLGLVNVFVSSDGKSISVGGKWLNEIDAALQKAQIELILSSVDSIKRPWINFEAGAGWVKGIPVIPVCHTGMRPVDLPIPLNMLNAIQATDKKGLEQIYGVLSKQLGSTIPNVDFTNMIQEVNNFEYEYGLLSIVRTSVRSIIQILPNLEEIFNPHPTNKGAQGNVMSKIVEKLQPHLENLQSRGMLTFSTIHKAFFIGDAGSGDLTELKIFVNDDYYAIAQDVME